MSEPSETLTIEQALDRAGRYFAARRLTEAENICQHILASDPDNDTALRMLGLIALQVCKYDIAADLMSRAIAIRPDIAESHHNLGITLNALGKPREAVVSYRHALAINPGLAETHNNLGLTLCKLNKVHDGITEYQKALGIRPEFFDAHVNLGVALCSIGRFDDAVVSYQNALAIRPDSIVARMNLGDALRGLGRLEEAIASYQAVIDADPKEARACNEKGNALRSLGRLDEAVASYRQALIARPDFAEARRNEGSTLQELGRLEEAISSLVKANTPLARANLLECLYASMDEPRFYAELDRISAEESANVGVAAISAFASNQFGRANPYPFCTNPLDFVVRKNLGVEGKADSSFLEEVKKQLAELRLDSGNQPLLKSGTQSAPTLFADPRGSLAELRAILDDEIAAYRSEHAASDCLLITEWPDNYRMTAWYVLMQQGGHLTLHNHPDGWLSGVFYLEVPPGKGNEANIEFGLHGNNWPIVHYDYPRKTVKVREGDLLMFPSSLFHRTLPFQGQKSRLCIAFDVNPIRTVNG